MIILNWNLVEVGSRLDITILGCFFQFLESLLFKSLSVKFFKRLISTVN